MTDNESRSWEERERERQQEEHRERVKAALKAEQKRREEERQQKEHREQVKAALKAEQKRREEERAREEETRATLSERTPPQSFFTSEQVEVFSKSTVKADFLIKFEFQSQTAYVWNGNYKLEIDGNVYLPMFGLGRIEGLGAIQAGNSSAVTLTLVGIPNQETDILALALTETPEANQQLATIYMQLFDTDWQPKGPLIPVFFGFMQPPRIERSATDSETGSQQTIQMALENALFNRSRPPYGRYSDRDQQMRHPGDKAFQFTSSLLSKTFTYPDY